MAEDEHGAAAAAPSVAAPARGPTFRSLLFRVLLITLITLAALSATPPNIGVSGAIHAPPSPPPPHPDQQLALDPQVIPSPGGGARFAAMFAPPTPTPVEEGGWITPRRVYFPRGLDDPDLPLQALLKRSDECQQNYHPCNELGAQGSSVCCENTQYCVLDVDWTPGCCALDAHCVRDCDIDQLLCNATVTVTVSSISGTTLTSPVTTTSLSQTCCARLCTTSTAFLCANSQGCCSFGSTCGNTGNCVGTPTSAATSGLTTTPTGGYGIIPAGCSRTDEFSCPTDQGSGCCVTGQVCTIVNAEPVCSSAPEGGLSIGAKAGIGAGAAVTGGIAVACVTWCVLSYRAKKRREAEEGGGLEGRMVGSGIDSEEEDEDPTVTGTGTGGGRRRGGRGRRARPAMSERTRTTTTNQYSGGGGNIYVGPDAVAGPYTQPDSPIADMGAGMGGRDGIGGGQPGHLHGHQGRSVVVAAADGMPHGPDDVVAPVEIDGRVKEDETERHPITRVRVLNATPGGMVELPVVQQGHEAVGAGGAGAAGRKVKRKPVRGGSGGSGVGAVESPVMGHLTTGEFQSMTQPDSSSSSAALPPPLTTSAATTTTSPSAAGNLNRNSGVENGIYDDNTTIAAASPGDELPTPSPFLSPDAENMDPLGLGTPSPNTSTPGHQPSPLLGGNDITPTNTATGNRPPL